MMPPGEPERNPYAPPAAECAPAEASLDELGKHLKSVHEECGALAVAWGVAAAIGVCLGCVFSTWDDVHPLLPLEAFAIAALFIPAAILTWRIRRGGLMLGLTLCYVVLASLLLVHPGLLFGGLLFLIPLIFQGHRILANARRLQRAGVELN